MTKLMTVTAAKGGVGKTTISYNYGAYLAKHHQKVLLFDLDESCNLSHDFDIHADHRTVGELFKPNDDVNVQMPQIHQIDVHGGKVDVISGNLELDFIQNKILTEANHNQRILNYLRFLINENHFNYDYVIFDCHQNFNIATCNAILCSHLVLSPITPDENGYKARFEVEQRLEHYRQTGEHDPITNKSLIQADLKYIVNNVRLNTTAGRQLLNVVADDQQVIKYIPNRELFNKAALNQMDIFTYAEQQRYVTPSDRKFLAQVTNTFDKITEALDQSGSNIIDYLTK